LSSAQVSIQPLPLTGREVMGLDVGLKDLPATAEGVGVEHPRLKRQAARLGERILQKVRRQQGDYHLRTALALPRHYDILYLADPRAANLVRSHCRSRSFSDSGRASSGPCSPARQHGPERESCWSHAGVMLESCWSHTGVSTMLRAGTVSERWLRSPWR